MGDGVFHTFYPNLASDEMVGAIVLRYRVAPLFCTKVTRRSRVAVFISPSLVGIERFVDEILAIGGSTSRSMETIHN